MKKLTQKYLKECLTYNPDTGIFIWKERPIHHFKDGKKRKKESICNQWNSAFANKHTGKETSNKYITIMIDAKGYLAHRLVWLYMEGYFPEHQIDHIDRNPCNNKRINLREATCMCNMQNCEMLKNNTSGVKGVRKQTIRKKYTYWIADIQVRGKLKFLGSFKEFVDAVWARYNEEQDNSEWSCSVNSSAFKYLNENNLIQENL